MKSCNRAYEEAVRRIVSRELDSHDVRLTPIPTYPDTVVYLAATEDRSVVFKGSDPDGEDPDGIALEAWALEAARAQNVPVPEVLSVDVTKSVYPGSFMNMKRVSGVSLDRAGLAKDDFDRVVRSCGAALRRLHEVKTSGFGRLDEDVFAGRNEVAGSYPSWREALLAFVPAAAEYLAQSALTGDELDSLRTQVDAIGGRMPDVLSPCLMHGDFGESHVYIDPTTSEITGIVDFGERSSGDWVWDFCEWDLASVDALITGYGVTGDERDGVARQIDDYLLIKAVPWAAKWHRRGETQVVDWLRFCLRRPS